MGDSRQSVAALQTQLDDYRERSRKDMMEAQRNNKDRLAEVQRAQSSLKAQQEEVENTGTHGHTVSTTFPWFEPFAHLYANRHVGDEHRSTESEKPKRKEPARRCWLKHDGAVCLAQVSRLKKELLVCSEERDSAQLDRDLLSNRLKHLESELESEKSTHTDRTREIRGLEVRL